MRNAGASRRTWRSLRRIGLVCLPLLLAFHLAKAVAATTTSTVVTTTTSSSSSSTVATSSTTSTTILLCDVSCGDYDNNGAIAVTDALAVLEAAVGLHVCPLVVCDVNSSGGITVKDALRVLEKAVGLPVDMACPQLLNPSCVIVTGR